MPVWKYTNKNVKNKSNDGGKGMTVRDEIHAQIVGALKGKGAKFPINMTRIKPVEKEEASDEVKIIYNDIEAAFGMVPNLFKTYAHFPALLRVNWEKTKALMMGGELPRELKESIAVVVSAANVCDYCVAAHSMALGMMGFSKEKIETLVKNIEKSELTPKDQKILKYVRKATLTPHKITDSETDELKSTGLTDSQIVEILGVMELFTGYNKFLDALAVEIDFLEA